MSCTGTSDCLCGCCSGISVQTPQGENNVPGLAAIGYRTGAWATFKQSMQARLSSAEYPALAQLKTRDDDDFSIALLDASSVMLDILTFYQERLANESYLRTSTQLQSLTELARLIGYQPAPGVSSSVYLSFTLQAAPGSPLNPTTTAITIPKGTQVQSVPAQGQTPQTFETSAAILAKADWNALPVQCVQPWLPASDDPYVYLQGTVTQLQPGDLILIVGDERAENPGDPRWDVRLVTTVTPDTPNKRTYVEWSEGLGGGGVGPAQLHPKFYAFRQRAALFGYNTVAPIMLSDAKITISNLQTAHLITASTNPEWVFSAPSTTSPLIDLDAVYPKLVVDGWIALIHPDANVTRSPAGFVSLYRINSVTSIARSAYSISAKISRAAVDTDNNLTEYYDFTRETTALVQSEELPVAPKPLIYPLYGTTIDLQDLRPDLAQATMVAITGPRQKLSLQAKPDVIAGTLQFVPDDDPSNPVTLNPEDIVIVTDPTPLPPPTDANWKSGTSVKLNVQDASGRPGTVQGPLADFLLTPSTNKDPQGSECAAVTVSTTTDPYPHTILTLNSALLNVYDRTATTVNANVGLATQGMSVSEILGSGSASTPNQKFSLKQTPLTFVQSPTPTGRLSTLQVKANSVAWTEVSSLYQQPPSAQVFSTMNQPGGNTDILFGDLVEGSTPPTGQNNIHANYRVGSGFSGNVGAGTITTLMDRPLGVSGVNNPAAATGGQDAQSVDDIRANAPLSVLTLGRAVSITDYQNFAQSFAGIAKAYATWIPSGVGRGVFITVAGAGGAALLPGNPTLANLVTALHNYGNPLIPINAVTFFETLFGMQADLAYDPAYDSTAVRAAVLQALQTNYSFANRGFGQGVSSDEVSTFIQAVPGVVAVNVKQITLETTSNAGDLSAGNWSLTANTNWLTGELLGGLPRLCSGSPTRICPYVPVANVEALPYAAEILVLDPNPDNVQLGVLA